jgi:DNA-binding NarL/FixJ family response regulator
MNPLRILVADDHEIVRRGLVSLLKSHAGWDVCGEAQDGREAVEVAPGGWEVSRLDVHITGSALFFHAIGEQQHEVRTQFQPVPSDLSLAEEASRVAGDSNVSHMGWRGGSQ